MKNPKLTQLCVAAFRAFATVGSIAGPGNFSGPEAVPARTPVQPAPRRR